MNEKSKRNIILIIIAVFVIATGLISLAMYNITKSSGKKNSKDTTATMSDAGSITTEAGTTEATKDSAEDGSTTEQATTTEEVKDSKATTEAVASSSSKKDNSKKGESNSNPKPSSNSNGNSGSGNNGSNSSSDGNNNSGNQNPNNSSSGSSNNGSSNSSNNSSSSGSGSTNSSNGNSSSSNNSNTSNSQSSCSHNWVQVFIHHDQVKHTEYYTTTEVVGYHDFCRGCNLDLTATYGGITDEAAAHLTNCRGGAGASYEGRPIYQDKQVPYDVIDQEAYDEPAGYKCSICGATK